MKTPDEIKKGLECCSAGKCTWDNGCPYGTSKECAVELKADALALIQQLEAYNAQLERCIENMTDKLNAANDATQRWIPVDERMPEHEGWVLAIGLLLKKKKGSYGWSVPHVAEFRHGRWCDFDGMLPDLEDRSIKITHWMPLPEPPKEESPVGGNSDDFVHGNHG